MTSPLPAGQTGMWIAQSTLGATPTPQTYGELQYAFSFFNTHLFEGRLPACLITLQRKGRTKGYFSPERFTNAAGERVHEIALNPQYFAATPIEVVLSTLAHEMVHEWQYEYGQPGRRGYHNRQWAERMKLSGLIPSASGQPGGRETGERMTHYLAEGGLYLQVCQALLSEAFRLTWYDRFLPSLHVVKSGPGSEPGQVVRTPAAEPAALTPALASQQPETFEEPLPQTSNRRKYRCPKCRLQVWGKPGLKVNCGACQAELQEVSA